jgi:antibiotic biosynthesis monooxygenase (ABM) superfamily enzyme
MLEPNTGLFIWKILAIAMLILYPVSLIWAYRDAERRGKEGLLLTLLVAITFVIGLLVWFVVRPERQEKVAARSEQA